MSTVIQGLALAREEFPPIHKNREAYQYKYADLQAVLEAVTPALRKQGLELVQTVQLGYISTELHSVVDPEAKPILSRTAIPEDATSQALGSAITYARRYAIVCMLGLVTEEDDDGASNTPGAKAPRTRQEKAKAEPEAPPAPEGWESDEQALAAHNALRDRIVKLPEEWAEQCVAYRKEHGWPLTVEKFTELETIVELAESAVA
jgi:hypothetical protein